MPNAEFLQKDLLIELCTTKSKKSKKTKRNIGYNSVIGYAKANNLFMFAESLQDIHDVKPPVDFPANYFWSFFFLIGILALGSGYFIRIILQKWQERKRPVDIPKTAWEIACEQLGQLENENLIAQGKFKEYYSRLSDIVRRYVEEQFHIRAPEMTTTEFLYSLEASSMIIDLQKEILRDFLTSCDLVKFAKHIPLKLEAEKAFKIVRKLIQETKNDL